MAFAGITSVLTKYGLANINSDLGLGIRTTVSWVFYYRAMKDGLVSYVAVIDKASIIIILLLSFFLLKEPMTPKVLVGAGLIFVGMIVLVWK